MSSFLNLLCASVALHCKPTNTNWKWKMLVVFEKHFCRMLFGASACQKWQIRYWNLQRLKIHQHSWFSIGVGCFGKISNWCAKTKNTKLMTLSNFQLMVKIVYAVSTMFSFYRTWIISLTTNKHCLDFGRNHSHRTGYCEKVPGLTPVLL